MARLACVVAGEDAGATGASRHGGDVFRCRRTANASKIFSSLMSFA
eukprot:CAMPEP_0115881136 /NCGR_PEP_ID=MMETSP0287-20121206/28260_1 /TAXON_ID=412157 /ORGANISM="Chrysochromulina rotalis, Strain UIO044" /LENGTH=45 /DNA_ID= /DNA_START= /DNA_END= /DNA_ORIENTATION=